MKRFFISAAIVVFFCVSVSGAGEKPSGKAAVGDTLWEVSFYYSLMNDFALGNMEDWYGDEINDGSPALFNIAAAMFTSVSEGVYVGVGLDFVIAMDHAIWEQNIPAGEDIVINPAILGLAVPLKYMLKEVEGLSFSLIPSLLIATSSGYYRTTASDYEFELFTNMSLGLGIGVSGEYMFSENAGAGIKTGMRFVGVPLIFKDPGSATGYSQFLMADTSPVICDLGGFYLFMGANFRI